MSRKWLVGACVTGALTSLGLPSLDGQFLDVRPYKTASRLSFRAMNLFSSGDTAGAKGEEKKTEASLFPQVGAQIMVGNLQCEALGRTVTGGEFVEVRPTFFKVTLPHLVAGSQVAAEKDDGNCATTMNLIGTNGGLVFVGLRFPIVAAGDGKSTFAVWFITQGKLIQYVRTADSSYQYEWSGHYSIPILFSGEAWGRRSGEHTKHFGVWYVQVEPFVATPSEKLVQNAYSSVLPNTKQAIVGVTGLLAVHIEGVISLSLSYLWTPTRLPGAKTLMVGMARKM